MPEIRANTVLPANRLAVTLHTADGLRLVGELAVPVARPPVATLVCLHPLPTHGGSMDSHVYRKAAWRLPALADLAVLRFNSRGTASPEGRSEGGFDAGVRERYDLAAALDLVEAEDLAAPWLVGWSFGSELVLAYGADDPTVVGGILLSPPLRALGRSGLGAWAASGNPLTVLVPQFDDYLRPAEARQEFGVVPGADVVAIARAKHLFVGFTEEVLDQIVRVVAPASHPLSAEWPPRATQESA